jgi:AcrR family transcriptional regulator
MCYAGFVDNKTLPETMPAPLSGRQAEARRNDRLILEAAREVFVEDTDAPISAVAERAGVGIGALYRRYASKEELLRRLCSWTPTHTR